MKRPLFILFWLIALYTPVASASGIYLKKAPPRYAIAFKACSHSQPAKKCKSKEEWKEQILNEQILTNYPKDSRHIWIGDPWEISSYQLARVGLQNFPSYEPNVVFYEKNNARGKINCFFDSSASGNLKKVKFRQSGPIGIRALKWGSYYPLAVRERRTNYRCTNDDIRSASIGPLPAGTTIKVFDHPKGKKNDDFTEITIKKKLPKGTRLIVPTFEFRKVIDSEFARIVHRRKNGLDGKISNIRIAIP